jgi:CRP-like cAMP-binding protein
LRRREASDLEVDVRRDDVLLAAIIPGSTATEIAERSGIPRREVIRNLNRLRARRAVVRCVDVDGLPVARWTRR